MKQTIVPTRWEKFFHLYIWGVLVMLGIITFFNLLCLLFITLALHITTFGEEQIAGCVTLIAIGNWIAGGVIGNWLHRRHLKHSAYLFSKSQIRLACLSAIVYTTVFYFVVIVAF